MLPIPAMKLWSMSSGLEAWSRRRASRLGRGRPGVIRRVERVEARARPARGMVGCGRGDEHLAEGAGVDEAQLAALGEGDARRGCAWASGSLATWPAAAGRSCAGGRRARRRCRASSSRYLPLRSTPGEPPPRARPRTARSTSWRRTDRRPVTSTALIRAPTTSRVEVAPDGLDLGKLRHPGQLRPPRRRLRAAPPPGPAATPPPGAPPPRHPGPPPVALQRGQDRAQGAPGLARRGLLGLLLATGPRRGPRRSPPRRHDGEEPLGVVGALVASRSYRGSCVERAGRPAPAAGSCSPGRPGPSAASLDAVAEQAAARARAAGVASRRRGRRRR